MTTSDRTNGAPIAQADDVVRHSAVTALVARGVVRPDELLPFNTPTAILGWCRWWDAQTGVGKELLADRIRGGGTPPLPRRSMQQQQQEYGEHIVDWLRKHFPQWNRDTGNRTHTAAIAEVIRLHHRHGKGRLTKREHGPAIRAAVKKWDQTFKQEPEREE